jgi:pimeloyl-ACP methyl ester carboxylesterase
VRSVGSKMSPVLDEVTVPLPPARNVASTDGVSLATYDLGGTGRDVLFVHATGFHAGVWGPMSAELTEFHRVALDVRGHGHSSAPENGMAWEGTSRDVLATVDTFGLDRPIGVGHSMGGASLLLAEQARPGTFSLLWLFEPILIPAGLDLPGENPLAAGAARRRPDFPSKEEAFANFAHKPPLSALAEACLAAYVEYGFEPLDDGPEGWVTLLCRPEVESETFRMGSRHHAFEHLDEVGCPVIVVRGGDDGAGPASFAPLIVDPLPDGRLEDHPDLGHFGPLEAPEAMAASVRSAARTHDLA